MRIGIREIMLTLVALFGIIYIIAICKYFAGDPSWIYTLKMLDTRSPVVIINK